MKVYVIGGANIDISGKAESSLRLKDSNPGTISLSFGGVARNIAENLARLGISVNFISAFSDDLMSMAMLKHLESLKINTKKSLVIKNSSTSTYLALLSNDNDMAVALSDTSILKHLNVKYIKSVITKIRKDDILVIDTNLDSKVLDYIFKNAKGKIFVDPISTAKTKKIKPYLSKIYALKPNVFEAEELVNKKITTNKDVANAAKILSAKGVIKSFVSMGKMGAYGFVDGQGIFIRTGKISIKSATGAGDAFMAGLVVSEIRGYNLLQTLKYATGCSIIAISSEKTVSDKINDQAVKRLMRGINHEN